MERLKTMTILALLVALASSIALAVTTSEAEVRISARLNNGRVEFALQQHIDGEWGNRILPDKRFFPVQAGHTRWLNSEKITVGVSVPVDALELEEPGVYTRQAVYQGGDEIPASDPCAGIPGDIGISDDEPPGSEPRDADCPDPEPDPNDENPPEDEEEN